MLRRHSVKQHNSGYDITSMPEPARPADRRRSPRFSCGGRALIYSLPSEGIVVPGQLQNLSLGGICVDAAQPMVDGARTEIVVSVNGVSFRAIGQVRAIQQGSRACMEFVQMSAGGRDLLADLIEHLTRFQATLGKVRGPRLQREAEILGDLEGAGIRAMNLGSVPAGRRLAAAASTGAGDESSTAEATIGDGSPLFIQIDVFG
jgi:hypothetical protein